MNANTLSFSGGLSGQTILINSEMKNLIKWSRTFLIVKILIRKCRKNFASTSSNRLQKEITNKLHEIISIGKASIETRDNTSGSSLLSIAVSNGHTECVEKMIEGLSPNVNTRDHKGWTPLMKAVVQDKIKLTRILIEAGADLNFKNNMNFRAIDLVKSDEMKNFLREEIRKASCFDFEQMINFQLNLKDPQGFLNGTTTLYNVNQSFDEEEGNFEIFKKFAGNDLDAHPKSKPHNGAKSGLPSIKSSHGSRNLNSKSMAAMRKPKKELKEKHDLPYIQKRIKKYESGSKKMLTQFRYLSPPPIETEMLVNMSQPSPLVNIKL